MATKLCITDENISEGTVALAIWMLRGCKDIERGCPYDWFLREELALRTSSKQGMPLPLTPDELTLLSHIREVKEATIHDLAEYRSSTVEEIERHLKYLLNQDLVRKTEAGIYKAVDFRTWREK